MKKYLSVNEKSKLRHQVKKERKVTAVLMESLLERKYEGVWIKMEDE